MDQLLKKGEREQTARRKIKSIIFPNSILPHIIEHILWTSHCSGCQGYRDEQNLHRGWQFSIATISKYHKLSGLKQQKNIILQFWRSVIQNGSYQSQIKISSTQDICITSVSFRGKSVSMSFPVLQVAFIPELMAPHPSVFTFLYYISFSDSDSPVSLFSL